MPGYPNGNHGTLTAPPNMTMKANLSLEMMNRPAKKRLLNEIADDHARLEAKQHLMGPVTTV